MKAERVLALAVLVSASAVPQTVRMAEAQVVHTATGCANCHQLHGATGSTLSNFAIAEDLCLSCHTDGANPNAPAGVSTHLSPSYVAGDSAATCATCHTPHRANAGTNLALIRTSIATPNSGTRTVIFTSRGTDAVAGSFPSTLPGAGPASHSFADGDATYDGVCEACHTQTTNHQNGTVLPDNSDHAHNAALQCTRCHLHAQGFQGGGPCAACHDAGGQGTTGPNSRRPIIPEMARASHHVGSAYADNDCRTCHDMSQHQQGTVRLKNQDDTTTVYALAASPLTDSSVARTLIPFCLSCHDGSAGGRTKPFSDSVVVPVIDTATWRLATHKTAAPVAGCLGDGSFGCHGTAHGSQKAKLLGLQPAASPDSGATPGYYQEEGFCFNCHRSGGAASTKDLLTPFSTAIKWVTAAVGASGNTRLNDRHDVQRSAQSTSGAKIECTDCHNPHSATAAQPWKTDPDLNDGRIPGTGQVMAGVSFKSEFCLDCHDGSFPATVTAPTTALIDVRTTHATDQMGAGSGAPTLKGYGWAQGDIMSCEACHRPHVSGNFFHAVDVVYSKDGTTPVPSDGSPTYTITNNNIRNTAINGWDWCNTCHTGSMGDRQTNCYGCHYHGSGRW